MYLRTWDNSVNANSQFQAFFHSPCLLVLRSTAAPIPTLQGAAPRASEDATWPGFLGGLKLAQPLPSPLERSVSLPISSRSWVRDTVTSSVPPTRDALTIGPDMRMTGGMKTRREERDREELIVAEPLPTLGGGLLWRCLPQLWRQSQIWPQDSSSPHPRPAGPCPALHTQVSLQRPQDALKKEEPQKQRDRRRQTHAWRLAGPAQQDCARLKGLEARGLGSTARAALQAPSCQANAWSYGNHQSAAGLTRGAPWLGQQQREPALKPSSSSLAPPTGLSSSWLHHSM